MSREQTIQTVLGLFGPGTKVALAGHINPDGDSIGSMLALAELLKARGCQVVKLLPNDQAVPAVYGFMGEYGLALDFVPPAQYHEDPDLFIALDLSQSYRLDQAGAVFARSKKSLVIDHHPNPDDFSDYMLHDETAAAVGLLVWELIGSSGEKTTLAMASACYLALLTDTGRFSFQNTNAQVLAAAAEMTAAGADPASISQAVYDTRSLGSLKLDARLVERMEYLVPDKVVYSWVYEDDFAELGVALDDTESLINLLRSVAGAELAILLREDGIQVRVNLRARGSYNASKLASDHGGGGHQAAAGFNFAGTIPEAATAIRHYLESEGILAADSRPNFKDSQHAQAVSSDRDGHNERPVPPALSQPG
ncbi:MAG: DHH family phosphoesterase [Coriobacteriia bacterium]|nr:DHH family phosphoesterase [Coriobacteriia bacterium]